MQAEPEMNRCAAKTPEMRREPPSVALLPSVGIFWQRALDLGAPWP